MCELLKLNQAQLTLKRIRFGELFYDNDYMHLVFKLNFIPEYII